MSENRNIYKMDDFLIIVSFLMLIPAGFIAWPWLRTLPRNPDIQNFIFSAPTILGPRIMMAAAYLGGSVLTQIAGRFIRHDEKQSLDILDTLQYMRKSTVPQLASQLGFSESKTMALVRKLSRISSLNIHFDGTEVSLGASAVKKQVNTPETEIPKEFIINTIQKTVKEQQNQSHSATEKEEKIEEAWETLEKKMDQSGMSEKNKEMAKAFLRNGSLSANGKVKGLQGLTAGGKKFNVVLFFILFMTPLWPVALIYAIMFALKLKKENMTGQTNGENQENQ